MEPVAFTFRNDRLTAELMTPCGVGAAQLASELFSISGFIQYIQGQQFQLFLQRL